MTCTQSDTEQGQVRGYGSLRRTGVMGDHFESKTAANGLKFFIFVPAKLERLEQTEKYDCTMQVCPACGGKLVLFHDKFGDMSNDPVLSHDPGRPPAGRKSSASSGGFRGSDQWNPSNVNDSDHDRAGNGVSGVHGGWYCDACGVHVIADMKPSQPFPTRGTKAISRSMEALNAKAKYANSESSGTSFKGVVVDEHFEELTGHFQHSFKTLMSHIREHFLLKEAQLKEYQVDLCQRERTLRTNEEYVDQRYSNLQAAEQVLADKTDRMHHYKDNVLTHLEGRARQLSQYEHSLKEWREQMIRDMEPRPRDHYQQQYDGPEYVNHRMFNQAVRQGEVKPRLYSEPVDVARRRSYRQSWHEQDHARHADYQRSQSAAHDTAAKPPLPAQRFGPIYQYAATRTDNPAVNKESWAGRPGGTNNSSATEDSPASKPSATSNDLDSGYTTVSLNRSASPERSPSQTAQPANHMQPSETFDENKNKSVTQTDFEQRQPVSHIHPQAVRERRSLATASLPKAQINPVRRRTTDMHTNQNEYSKRYSYVASDYPSSNNDPTAHHNATIHPAQQRVSNDLDHTHQNIPDDPDPDKTKPLHVYTTCVVQPEDSLRYQHYRENSTQGHVISPRDPVYYHDNPAAQPSHAQDSYRRRSHYDDEPPRSWLEGPRRVTEL